MLRPTIATVALLALLGCPGGGNHKDPVKPDVKKDVKKDKKTDDKKDEKPVTILSSVFTYPANKQDRYPELINRYYKHHPAPKSAGNKSALIAKHLQWAELNYATHIAGSKVEIFHPSKLSANEIAHTELESAGGKPVQNVNVGIMETVDKVTYHLTAAPYSYRAGEAYVDFANREIGGGVLRNGFSQEEIAVLETNFLPWVAAVRDGKDQGTSFCPNVSLKQLDEQPVVIKVRRFLEMAHQDEIYGSKLKKVADFNPDKYLLVLPEPQDIYLTAMAAKSFRAGSHYTQADISAMTHVAIRAFYDTMLAQARDGKPLVIHTGNWGTGVYNNSRRTIWAIQRVAMEAAYVLFCQTTKPKQAPKLEYHYDAFDAEGVREANEALNVFTQFPAHRTVEDYTHLIFKQTQADPAWQVP